MALSVSQIDIINSGLENVIACMPGFIYWKNRQLQYMWCNDNFAKIMGLKSRFEVTGKNDYDFSWGKEIADLFIVDDRRVMQEAIALTKEYELPIKREDGHFLFVRTDKMPLYDEKKNIVGVLAVAVDITDQKLAECETHIAHTFLEDIMYNLPGYIYWKDKQSRYVGFNKNVVRLSGLTREELLGKTDSVLNWGAKQAESFQNDDREVIETGITKITEHQIPIKRPDGHYIFLRTEKSRLYDREGNVAGVLGVAIDITDEKILEKMLNDIQAKATQEAQEVLFNLDNIIANMPGYIYWKNINSEYMGCNDNLARVSGLKNRSEIIGKTDYDFNWGKSSADKFREDDQRVMQNKQKQVTEYELPITREDGANLYVRTEKMPLFNTKNEAIGILAIAVDITDQKLLEKALLEDKIKIEKLSQYKTDFIRNMEHDIRTPFSGVYSIANILEKQETEQEKKYLLSAIGQCAKELLEYCNGILDFSRIEAGVTPVLSRKFDLKDLINGVIAMEKPPALDKQLKLIMDYQEDLPTVFLSDQYRIQRILINLVSNAVKFTNQGYVKLSVKLAKQTDDKNYILRFDVEDTGIGIPKEQQLYIFERFSRLTPSNQGKYKGSGLGLSIVKHLIGELGGEIEVKSSPEKGTTFVCILPLKRPLTDEILFEDDNDS